MTTILVTGGNKGLGFEAARRLIELGHKVYIGARDPERGRAAAEKLGAQFVCLDVTDDQSVEAAAKDVLTKEGHLDVLINNAGISGGMTKPFDMTVEEIKATYETNVFGIVRVTRAFTPLLKKSKAPVIVNVSSGLGSFAVTADKSRVEYTVQAAHYNSSKAAVNMLTVQYAKAMPEFRVNCVDPGYTATDLNHNSGPQTVAEGTDAVVKMATIGQDGPTGTFSDRRGVVAW